jgi:8-oxo-dGTP pyrophosphatase MutT (NUDIX family)
MNHSTFEYTRGVCCLQPWVESIQRERVMAIVQHAITKKYCIVQYTSNNEISFPAGGIEAWDSKEKTVRKELCEETGIESLQDLEEKTDWFFEVRFFSPKRNKNFYNLTHVFLATTTERLQIEKLLGTHEQAIQLPHRRSFQAIRKRVDTRWHNTNYEAMDFLLDRIVSSSSLLT